MTTTAAGRPAPLLRLRDVSHTYGEQPVLLNVDLDVAEGEVLGIVGPSGSGKTTLLRILLGAVGPTRGRIERRPGLRAGYVPQVETVNWQFPVTVAEVVLMARTGDRRWPWPSRDERRQIADVLDRLGLGSLGHRHIRELSGGQQQRVFIARALVGRPDVLFLDEPTSGVDVKTRHEVLHLLAELHADGLAIVLSTHDLNGIATHLPKLLCLNVSVAGSGHPRDVLTPEILELVYGAPMDVLEHAGMPLVVDRPGGTVIDMRRRA
ncbi:MAG: metal ABC transporter ATP-binding protein [Actinomycetota bacterium]|nr:metal ABC transporter ATP-binding protein [Actinomycetota bacterium]